MRVLLVSLPITPPAVIASREASPYVPLQQWAIPYVERLISAGVIEDPTPLMRPLNEQTWSGRSKPPDTLHRGRRRDTGPRQWLRSGWRVRRSCAASPRTGRRSSTRAPTMRAGADVLARHAVAPDRRH